MMENQEDYEEIEHHNDSQKNSDVGFGRNEHILGHSDK